MLFIIQKIRCSRPAGAFSE